MALNDIGPAIAIAALVALLASGVNLHLRFPSDRLLRGRPAIYTVLLVLIPTVVAVGIAAARPAAAVVGGLAAPPTIQGRRRRQGAKDHDANGPLANIEKVVGFLGEKLGRELSWQRMRSYSRVLHAIAADDITWEEFADRLFYFVDGNPDLGDTEKQNRTGQIAAALDLALRPGLALPLAPSPDDSPQRLRSLKEHQALLDLAYAWRAYDLFKIKPQDVT